MSDNLQSWRLPIKAYPLSSSEFEMLKLSTAFGSLMFLLFGVLIGISLVSDAARAEVLRGPFLVFGFFILLGGVYQVSYPWMLWRRVVRETNFDEPKDS